MASREYYKKLQQQKIDKLTKPAISIPVSDSVSVKIEDKWPAEEAADYMMNKTLRTIYNSLFAECLRSEKHYRLWLKEQGRNENGYVITSVIDGLDVNNIRKISPKERMKYQCRLHDEAELSYAKEIYEAIPRNTSFKEFLKRWCKSHLININYTYESHIKVRDDDFWCGYIADSRRDKDREIEKPEAYDDTKMNIKF